MNFHVPNKDIQYLTLKIDNVIIEKVDEFSFLWLTVDTNLNWKRYSEKVCNKCTKLIGNLNMRGLDAKHIKSQHEKNESISVLEWHPAANDVGEMTQQNMSYIFY